jgi:hypothetical protein
LAAAVCTSRLLRYAWARCIDLPGKRMDDESSLTGALFVDRKGKVMTFGKDG